MEDFNLWKQSKDENLNMLHRLMSTMLGIATWNERYVSFGICGLHRFFESTLDVPDGFSGIDSDQVYNRFFKSGYPDVEEMFDRSQPHKVDDPKLEKDAKWILRKFDKYRKIVYKNPKDFFVPVHETSQIKCGAPSWTSCIYCGDNRVCEADKIDGACNGKNVRSEKFNIINK